jgi:3-oxoisoapionate decarboxylase
MNRRSFLASVAAAGVRARLALETPAPPEPAPHTAMGVNLYSFHYRRPQSAYDFLDYCHRLGAGGVQTELDSLERPYLVKLRRRAEELGMYLEVIADLPRADTAGFERTVSAAKDAGALCLRTACLSGRRYENFSTLDEWQRFVTEAKSKVATAVSIVEKYRLPMAIENHKDWTAEELAALLKDYSSAYLGACIDTGNNIALLDDPIDVVERLAPYALSTHLKDMAAEEYEQGFLLAEVPLGEGMLDMKRILGAISRARPKTKFTLEMITRDPLQVPCLTDKYWATFPGRNGRFLAHTLELVRGHKPRRPLTWPDREAPAARLELEESNVKRCLDYARQELGLT